MRLIKAFFLLLFIIVLSNHVLAKTQDLVINGDNISYDKQNNVIEGAGSVEVIYKDVSVYGEHIIYNTALETVKATEGFKLNYEGLVIHGETLDYQVVSKEGFATDVQFYYEGVELGGETLVFNLEKFKLNNALFTTCDREDYYITASEIVLYPKYGWLVAYWGWFWLKGLPVVPVPTYIYDVFDEASGRKNLPPFPILGSNDEDGTYVEERLAWHIRRELSGTYAMTYAEKKGLGGGAQADYIINDNNRGNIRLYGNNTDSLFGGITHRYFFGSELGDQEEGLFQFLALPKHRRYELITNISHRERINYQRVSYYPKLTLRSRRGALMRPEAQYDGSVSLSRVSEENNLQLEEAIGNVKFYWDFPELPVGDITPLLNLDARFYSNGTKWLKSGAGFDLKKEVNPYLSYGLGYLHYFLLRGQSPFNFEMYRWRAADRLSSNLVLKYGLTGIGVDTSYFLDTWQAEDIDYSLFLGLRCYTLILKYRSLRREFSLGFSLEDY